MSRLSFRVAGLVIAGGAIVATTAVMADDRQGNKPKDEDKTYATTRARPAETDASAIIANWPVKPKEVANAIIMKYGEPNEATASMLVWHDNGPWKRTIVYRDEVAHEFPMPHTDIVEQFIDYKVPSEKFDELAAYDGSVVAKRTEGELSARCDKEEMNFLALNLAVDIIEGEKTVAEARATYADNAMKAMKVMKAKKPDPSQLPAYVQKLQFEVPTGDTADKDKPFKPAKAAK
jgi:hypothetical protein